MVGTLRNRFKIRDCSQEDQRKWSILMEAVRYDYIRKGQDLCVHTDAKKKIKKIADDRELIHIINHRYVQFFGHEASKLSPT